MYDHPILLLSSSTIQGLLEEFGPSQASDFSNFRKKYEHILIEEVRSRLSELSLQESEKKRVLMSIPRLDGWDNRFVPWLERNCVILHDNTRSTDRIELLNTISTIISNGIRREVSTKKRIFLPIKYLTACVTIVVIGVIPQLELLERVFVTDLTAVSQRVATEVKLDILKTTSIITVQTLKSDATLCFLLSIFDMIRFIYEQKCTNAMEGSNDVQQDISTSMTNPTHTFRELDSGRITEGTHNVAPHGEQ